MLFVHAYVDWIRPGFELSKQASFLKDAEGIILAHHGLIVWSDNSDECKQKNLDVINKVEKYLSSLSKRPESVFQHTDYSDEEYKNLLLQLRGRLNKKGKKLLSLDTRLKEISSRKDIDEILSAGVSSADHMLRIKPWSAVLNEPKDGEKSIKAIDNFATKYENYFESNKNLLPAGYSMNDSDPRVVLVPDLGAITTGHSLSECKMYADISFHTHKTAAMAKDSFGNVEGLPDSEIFGFDYWPMELYKLASKPAPKKFAGNIFIVTGAASGIGLGITLELAKLGASLVLADLDEKALNAAAEKVKEVKGLKPEIIAGDQSDEKVVNKTVDLAIKTFGGLDGVVLSAGIAVTDQLKDLSVDKWNKGLAVNLTSAFLMTKAAMNAMKIQNSGGSLVYIASKNAFAPGAGFGGYSVSKAGMLQLMRIAALEGGANQIRANAINPDAIFDNSKLWEGGIREERAKAHGVKPEELEDFYAQRNILKSHVTSKDVANTTAFLLSDESARTTGSVIAVDGGVAAAFPRTATTADEGTVAEATGTKPAPFDAGPVKIAIVQNSGAGDYFQQWTNGANKQAEAIGFEVQIYDAQADNAKQATDMETAIGSGVAGIIVDHGQADTMCPLINKALDAGIPVVVYDVATAECAPNAVTTQQSDASLAQAVLDQMALDLGKDVKVGYVNVLGIAPLDRRHVVWEAIVKANNWTQSFFVGKFTNSVATG